VIWSFSRIFCVALALLLAPAASVAQGPSAQAQRIAQLQEQIRSLELARAFTQDALNKVASGQYLIVSDTSDEGEANLFPISRDAFKETIAAQVLTGERSPDEAAMAAREVAKLTRAFAVVGRSRLSKLDFLITRARGELAALLRHQQAPSHPAPRPFGEAPG